MRAGIEPGYSSAQFLHSQQSFFEICFIDIGNFQFSPAGRLEATGDFGNPAVINIEPGHGIIRFGLFRLFFNRDHPAGLIKFYHAISLRVADIVSKDQCPALKLPGVPKKVIHTIEDIITQNQDDMVVSDELFSNDKGLRDT